MILLQVMDKCDFGHLSVVLPPSDDTTDTTYTCDVTLTSASLRKKFVPPPVAVKEEPAADGDVAVEKANGKAAAAAVAVVAVEEPEVEYDEKACLPKEKCLKVKTRFKYSWDPKIWTYPVSKWLEVGRFSNAIHKPNILSSLKLYLYIKWSRLAKSPYFKW